MANPYSTSLDSLKTSTTFGKIKDALADNPDPMLGQNLTNTMQSVWVAPTPVSGTAAPAPTIQLQTPMQPTPQQRIVGDMMSGSAFDPYREQAQEAQQRYERNMRASGAAIANQRGFAGQGIGDQMANTTEAQLARQRFDTNAALNVQEQATKERGADIAMEQSWKALDWASKFGSDQDFVQAYEQATGQRIDPMAVEQYRGYARTLVEQQIAAGETAETDRLTGYIAAAKGANAQWDWQQDPAAVTGIAAEYKRKTGQDFNINDPAHQQWADNFVGMAANDPISAQINWMKATPWFQKLPPETQSQMIQDVQTAGMAATTGLQYVWEGNKIVAAKYPDGTYAWKTEGYKTPEEQGFTEFQTSYQQAYPGETVDEETYNAIAEDLDRAPTAEEYHTRAPEVAGNVAFESFSDQYSEKYGDAELPDRDTYDAISQAMGKKPTIDDYKKYEKYLDPTLLTTADAESIAKDPVAMKLVRQKTSDYAQTSFHLQGSEQHGIVKFDNAPAKGQFFNFRGKLYVRKGNVEEKYLYGENQQFFSALQINEDGSTTQVYFVTPINPDQQGSYIYIDTTSPNA